MVNPAIASLTGAYQCANAQISQTRGVVDRQNDRRGGDFHAQSVAQGEGVGAGIGSGCARELERVEPGGDSGGVRQKRTVAAPLGRRLARGGVLHEVENHVPSALSGYAGWLM
jgi:hypothetical protein